MNVNVLGVDPDAKGLLKAEIELNNTPPEKWKANFNKSIPSGDISISISMHPPKVRGNKVMIRFPDDELEKYLDHVEERIDAVNEHFENKVLPRIKAKQKKEEEEREKKEKRINKAQKRADEIEDG